MVDGASKKYHLWDVAQTWQGIAVRYAVPDGNADPYKNGDWIHVYLADGDPVDKNPNWDFVAREKSGLSGAATVPVLLKEGVQYTANYYTKKHDGGTRTLRATVRFTGLWTTTEKSSDD